MENILETRKQLVRQRVQALITQANSILKTQLPDVQVLFDLRGKSAGQASRKNNLYTVRFNLDMMQNQGWNHLYNDTIAHEIAHICEFFLYDRCGHGRFWRQVCVALGGNGQRCHTEQVVFARGRTFCYTVCTGQTVTISETVHRRIQQGCRYKTRTGALIDLTCKWTIYSPA
jgi:predicted SprT family Zn-dependent metalloprotease